MGQFKLDAISLRYVNVKDNDRYVTLLTPKAGLVECFARRARRPKSPLMARTEPFVSGTWMGYQKGDNLYLDQVDVRYSFPRLNTDVLTLTSATQLADLVRDAAGDPGLSAELYELLHYALYTLESRPEDYKRITAATGLYILHLLGLAPDPQVCGICGNDLNIRKKIRVNHSAGYFVCHTHPFAVDAYNGQPVYEQVSAAVVETMDYLQRKEAKNCLSFTIGKKDEEALWTFSKVELMLRLERDWPNLRLLDELEKETSDLADLLKGVKVAREKRVNPEVDPEDAP